MVAHGTAKQAKIARRNAIVIVEREGEQGTYIHTEDERRVKTGWKKLGVEAVDSLDDDDRAFIKTKLVSDPFAPCRLEIEAWDFDLLASQQ